jgi:hypothetical protein
VCWNCVFFPLCLRDTTICRVGPTHEPPAEVVFHREDCPQRNLSLFSSALYQSILSESSFAVLYLYRRAVLALAWAQPGRAPRVQTHRAPTQAAAPVAQAVRFVMLNACAETQTMRGTRAARLLYSVRRGFRTCEPRWGLPDLCAHPMMRQVVATARQRAARRRKRRKRWTSGSGAPDAKCA